MLLAAACSESPLEHKVEELEQRLDEIEAQQQEQQAALLYGKATDIIERMVTAVEDPALCSIFLRSAAVQAIKTVGVPG